MYRIPTKPRVVDGKRRSYGGTVRDEALRLKMSAPVKVQNSSKLSGSFRSKLKNLQKNIRAISKSRINYCKEKKLSTSNVDVVGRVKVDGQSEYLMLHNGRPHAYHGYVRSQDMYDSFVKSKIAVCDEVKSINGKQMYLKLQNNHPDAYK